jgi:hypothetical protein
MQAHRDRVEVVVEQIRVRVKGNLADLCPSVRCNASTFTSADTDSDAQVCRRSCGVIACTFAFQIGDKQFSANDSAATWTQSMNVEINPGNSIQALVSFDVPPGTSNAGVPRCTTRSSLVAQD